MRKYEVRTFDVETRRGEIAVKKWENESNQETFLVCAYDTYEDAQKVYASIPVGVRDMGSYFLHNCKCIEVNDYNDDGEWTGGGDWDVFSIPEADA